MISTDICIVGAGPAGSIASLFLAKEGVNCMLIDKSDFPRDKICGDGLSGWVIKVLHELDEALLKSFHYQTNTLPSYGSRMVAPNLKILDLPFADPQGVNSEIAPGYTVKRYDFDMFLIEAVKKKSTIQFSPNTNVNGYKFLSNKVQLLTESGATIESKLVIFANGANSKFMKNPGNIYKTSKHTMTGIRAYFRGITGFHPANYVELHFYKDFLPGYLWIFPLSGGIANVGAGLNQQLISKKNINLNQMLQSAIQELPYLKKRFENAEQITGIEAYKLPLWDKFRRISGDHFLLAGDAANLIDPFTGEGIGHAAISGMFAAKQAVRSLKENNFSADFLQQYDKDVYGKIGKELKISRRLPKFIRYPWLFNAMINRAMKSEILQRKLSLAMTDLEVRERLKNPGLYLKLLMGK